MKLTEAEKAQIESQRAKQQTAAAKVKSARKTLLALCDEEALDVAKQIVNRREYLEARDKCGCLKRTDELCRLCKERFHRWVFGRIV